MEAQMKAICEGRSTRNDVVQQNLEQYRTVFTRTLQQINVLKAVRRFRKHKQPLERVTKQDI
jgi:DNA topoisomerase-3